MHGHRYCEQTYLNGNVVLKEMVHKVEYKGERHDENADEPERQRNGRHKEHKTREVPRGSDVVNKRGNHRRVDTKHPKPDAKYDFAGAMLEATQKHGDVFCHGLPTLETMYDPRHRSATSTHQGRCCITTYDKPNYVRAKHCWCAECKRRREQSFEHPRGCECRKCSQKKARQAEEERLERRQRDAENVKWEHSLDCTCSICNARMMKSIKQFRYEIGEEDGRTGSSTSKDYGPRKGGIEEYAYREGYRHGSRKVSSDADKEDLDYHHDIKPKERARAISPTPKRDHVNPPTGKPEKHRHRHRHYRSPSPLPPRRTHQHRKPRSPSPPPTRRTHHATKPTRPPRPASHDLPPPPPPAAPLADYYAMLGVKPACSAQDIKKSYRKLCLLEHPDKNRGDEGKAKRIFQGIQEAWGVLGDEEARSEYDLKAIKGMVKGKR